MKTEFKLTPKQNSFFHKPRTMDEITNLLFAGDAFAANEFQNNFIYAGILKVVLGDNPLGKEYAKYLYIAKV